MKLPDLPNHIAMPVLRGTMGIIFVTHGAARLWHGSVPDFGAYLDAQGLPVGVGIAWIVTIGEIVSGAFMAAGFLVRYCVLFHTIVILAGMIMIHIPRGWFVVGHGSGGVEYSLLILSVLAVIYSYGRTVPSRSVAKKDFSIEAGA